MWWWCLFFLLSFNKVLSVPILDSNIWENTDENNGIYILNDTSLVSADSPRINYSLIERSPRVLNFFPVPVEEECNSNDGRRKGICMNTYECRIKGGTSFGFCSLGFGVCCVFTATCNQETSNNITYFVNPHFPDLTKGMTSCSLTVKKMDEEITQLRLDFIHFNLGQPNRRTGVCEEDVFSMKAGNYSKALTMCGYNSGQHVYFDVDSINADPIEITMKLSRRAVSRLWEVRLTQIPFSQRSPAGCLQYHEGTTGIIQTMNFADNGRHLADQDYNICIRQEEGMCSIAYEPCHEDAFRISPNSDSMIPDDDEIGSGDGAARQMQICNDKITLPCDSDDLLMPDEQNEFLGYCDMTHCGASLCPSDEMPCRIESSSTPFVIGVHFGPSARDESPDDNLGMCLTYEQLPCG